MSFDWVSGLIKREPVLAGLERMQSEMRALVTRLVERFAARDATPLPITDEGAALALWGTEKPDAFLAWHREQGGLARSLEVLLAAIAYQRVTYEWNSSIWALRRARPSQGMFGMRLAPWVWLRTELAGAPAEHAAVLDVASRASRALVVRAAIAFTLPEVDELWTAADEAELRHADVDDLPTKGLGVLAMMRRAKLDHSRLARGWWEMDELIPGPMIAAELGARAVAPLRLARAYDELARHASPDALRALAEFADVAWDALAQIQPTAASIAALAPMFTTQRPRRVLGMQLARGLLAEFVVAAPADAQRVAGTDPFVASVIAETGAALPNDDGWVSPWTGTAKPKAAKPAKPKPIALPFTETIHWTANEREAATASGRERSADVDREMEHKVNELKPRQLSVLFLRWMTDEPALRTWKAVDSKRWYGHVVDVEHLLGRFGLAELDSIVKFVQTRPDTLAGLARVESPRVAPVMARGFALLKKQQDVGRAWLDRFPEAAAIGLLGDDATDKKQRDANDKALAYLSKNHESVVGAVLARAGGGASTAQLVAADAPTLPARRPKLPPFIDVERLPRPIRTDGKAALAGEPLVELVQVLAATLPVGHPALDAIAARYTAESLGRFAWSLFRQWLFAKGPPKHKWALYAVGKFSDDDNARALGRLARVWAPQGNSSRAQEAVEALAMMRTQGGLVEIHDISRKVQSKALKARAEKVFETVAENLGLAPEELADRLIPELSEEDLTFGDQRVESYATLTPHLAGKPDPDDAARWKELKRLCATVARSQLARLEQSMAEAHRMPFSHFAEIYLMHSLIRSISSSLLWGAYRDDKLRFAFAIDDGSPVDASGKLLELPVDARYGLVHPVELAEPERATWAARFADQPFEQLARKVFAADDAEACQLALAKLRGRVVPTASLLGLSRSGWRRAEAEHRGRYYSTHRHGQGWFAELAFAPGIYLGSPTEEATQSLEAIVFRADGSPPRSILSDIQRDVVQLGQL